MERLNRVIDDYTAADERLRRQGKEPLFKPTTPWMKGTLDVIENVRKHVQKSCLSFWGAVEEVFFPMAKKGPHGLQRWRNGCHTSGNEGLHKVLNDILDGRTVLGTDLMEASINLKVSQICVFNNWLFDLYGCEKNRMFLPHSFVSPLLPASSFLQLYEWNVAKDLDNFGEGSEIARDGSAIFSTIFEQVSI